MTTNALELDRIAEIRGKNIEYIGGEPALPPVSPELRDSMHRNILRQGDGIRKQVARLAGQPLTWLESHLKWVRAVGDPDFHEVLGIRLAPLSTRHVLIRIDGGEILAPLDETFEGTNSYNHELNLLAS